MWFKNKYNFFLDLYDSRTKQTEKYLTIHIKKIFFKVFSFYTLSVETLVSPIITSIPKPFLYVLVKKLKLPV